MINLSINVNKIATIRNSRGGQLPSVVHFSLLAIDCGVQGITVHPRPDERHITQKDVFDLKKIIPESIEYNIEGYPDTRFMSLVKEIIPCQATLVPDPPNTLTSDCGWDVLKNQKLLKKIVNDLHAKKIRVSLFLDPDFNQIKAAKEVGADRIEFYTGPFANDFLESEEKAAFSFSVFNEAAIYADSLGLEINAGHDLNKSNLKMFRHLHKLKEVSIGHAVVSEAIEFGWKNTIHQYLDVLKG